MIPGLPPLPHQFPGHPAMLPLLQQAWLSRASTMSSISSTMSSPSFLQAPHGGLLHFPHPFFHPVPPAASSPEPRRPDEAQDLSQAKRPRREEAVCPICCITMRWHDLPEHFETELRCLENIRSLSPITRPASSSSHSSRPFSSSPNKSSLSLSPSSPGHLENRWQRFERIRSKRRERIGAKVARHAQEVAREEERGVEREEADIDIGDSVSDCESGAGSEGELSEGAQHYTEADVLRAVSSSECAAEGEAREGALPCPSCSGTMTPPVLNTSCWHMRCERCWLRAVGTTKACSTCSSPATVRDLRRVHV